MTREKVNDLRLSVYANFLGVFRGALDELFDAHLLLMEEVDRLEAALQAEKEQVKEVQIENANLRHHLSEAYKAIGSG